MTAGMVVGAISVVGESHKRSNIPLQDASATITKGGHCVLAISDGAGSARFGGKGAQLIVELLLENVDLNIEESEEQSKERFHDQIRMTISQARMKIRSLAHELKDFHATVLCVAITPTASFVAQIGDGIALFLTEAGDDHNSANAIICPPENGEASNETFFYTEPDYECHLRINVIPVPILAAIAATDGMSDFIFDAGVGVKQNFLLPVIQKSSGTDSQSIIRLLEDIASDPRTNAFTSDDKTLAVAVSADASQIKAIKKQFNLGLDGQPHEIVGGDKDSPEAVTSKEVPTTFDCEKSPNLKVTTATQDYIKVSKLYLLGSVSLALLIGASPMLGFFLLQHSETIQAQVGYKAAFEKIITSTSNRDGGDCKQIEQDEFHDR